MRKENNTLVLENYMDVEIFLEYCEAYIKWYKNDDNQSEEIENDPNYISLKEYRTEINKRTDTFVNLTYIEKILQIKSGLLTIYSMKVFAALIILDLIKVEVE